MPALARGDGRLTGFLSVQLPFQTQVSSLVETPSEPPNNTSCPRAASQAALWSLRGVGEDWDQPRICPRNKRTISVNRGPGMLRRVFIFYLLGTQSLLFPSRQRDCPNRSTANAGHPLGV